MIMTQEYVFDEYRDKRGNQYECVAFYDYDGGCPGDYDTPPSAGSVELHEVVIRTYPAGQMRHFDTPVPAAYFNSICHKVETDIYNEITES